MNTGIELIAAERNRQINELGYTAEYDSCYAKNGKLLDAVHHYLSDITPGEPSRCIFDLTRAGALIAAEIDRLQFVQKQESPWISPNERHPNDGQRVIVRNWMTREISIQTFWRTDNGTGLYGNPNDPKARMIPDCWMPIPEAP